MPRIVTFPALEPIWNAARSSVQFYATDNRVAVTCYMPVEVLFEHFGVRSQSPEECLRAFAEHRLTIQRATSRKINSGPASKPGAAVTLLFDDFPRTTTTTTQAPRVAGLLTNLPSTLAANEQLLRAVESANAVLRTDFARPNSPVTATWETVAGPDQLVLLRLTLTDDVTGASSQTVFTQADLEASSFARHALFRLWDDMLREKGRRLMLAYQAAEEAGV